MRLTDISKSLTSLITEDGPPTDYKNQNEFDSEFSKIKGNDAPVEDSQESLEDLSKSLEDIKEPIENQEPNIEIDQNDSQNTMKQVNNDSGYSVNDVTNQLQGMVDNWFRFTMDMTPEAKEKFLALGERLAEISSIINSEFRK